MKTPPRRLIRGGDELTVDWLNEVRDIAVGNRILDLGPGLSGSTTPFGTTIGVKLASPPGPLFCSPSGGITAASGRPGSGSPGGPLTAQTVYQIIGGAWVKFDANASIYNGLEDVVVATKTLVVEQNADGTYSAIQQGCT